MEKLIFIIEQVIRSLADAIISSSTTGLVFLMDNFMYRCEEVSPATLKLSVVIYQTYDNPNWDTRPQKQRLLMLANALNNLEQPFTYYHCEGKLMLCHYFFTLSNEAEKFHFIERILDRFFTLVIFTKKHIMEDKVLAESLGQYGYLGHHTPQQRIAESHRWTQVYQYTEGLVAVTDEQGYYGFLNADNQLVIPCRWTDAWFFSEGLAAVADEQGRYGFINHAGTVVIPCEWHRAKWFSEGRAAVMSASGEWGFIDREARLVVPCIWAKVGWFEKGSASVLDAQSEEFFINSDGEIIFQSTIITRQ
jgi:hypothetical protein